MSSFNFFKTTDAFRFMAKVENSKNSINVDLIEVGINDPPKARDLFLTSSDKYHNYTMRTRIYITTINSTITSGKKGWYDSIDDLG